LLEKQLEQERVDSSNPKIAKLTAEIKVLSESKAQFEKELKPDLYPVSIHK
jgi:hypothetical protein